MDIQENYPLRQLNTFGIDANARYFVEVSSVDDIREFLDDPKLKDLSRLVLGEGSNILFINDYEGAVLKIGIPGREMVKEDDTFFYVKAGAGEQWHPFVLYCIKKGYAGVENLSLIPGSMGAAPLQNIGAYGVELKDVFEELEALDVANGKIKVFSNEDCRFRYRSSIFKNELKGKFIITSVTLRLRKEPEFHTSYGAIAQELESMGVEDLNIAAISEAVCRIRTRKLPAPAEMGNAGSFFKNPVVDSTKFEALKQEYPDIVGYEVLPPTGEGLIKLAAGWLIEKAGWKGKTFGNYGVHQDHSLVLVNYGGASGKDIYLLSEEIQQSVVAKFGVELEREVNVVK